MPQTLSGSSWSLSGIWNEVVSNPAARPMVARDYIYASEVGVDSYIDRYLKMYSVKPTNPPNQRATRKMLAGSAWEIIISMLLSSAGLLKKKQVKIDTQMKGLLSVHGRLDFVVGQPDNWAEAKAKVENLLAQFELMDLEVPPAFVNAIGKFIDMNQKRVMRDSIFEVKSVSSFVMDKLEESNKPLPHHAMQLFHYLNGNTDGITDGKLFYVSKDDCLTKEFTIYNSEELLSQYTADIKQMTKYYKAGFNPKKPLELAPPKNPPMLFNEDTFKFSKNIWVEYSPYLSLVYGFDTPESFRSAFMYKATNFNRVFKRFVDGEKITDKNMEVRAEAMKYFPNWDKMVEMAKSSGVKIQEDEDGD